MQTSQRGISLIEILVSLFIMTIGLIAVTKMQLYALQAVNNAYNTSVAIIRAESLRAIAQQNPHIACYDING